MPDNSSDSTGCAGWFKWLIATIIALLAAGGGIVALYGLIVVPTPPVNTPPPSALPPKEIIPEIIDLPLEEWRTAYDGKVTLYVSRISNDNTIRLRSNLWEDEWIKSIQECSDLAELERKTCERNADRRVHLDADPLIVNGLGRTIELDLVRISADPRYVTLIVTIQ